MTDLHTHRDADPALVGRVTSLRDGHAEASLRTSDVMRVDDHGLGHGSFVFGLLDYAAMVAVNDPNVVLGSADVRFILPVRVGQEIRAVADVVGEQGRKRVVAVAAAVDGARVAEGTLTAFVLANHVLSRGE